MKNLGEKIDVGFGARADDGTKLEAEEQPVVRRIESEANVRLGSGPTGSDGYAAAMPLSIAAEMPAHEAADVLSRTCERCAHFCPEEWPAARRAIEATPEGRTAMNKLRAELIARGGGELKGLEGETQNVEGVLARFGVCKALSAITGEPQMTLPEGCCPEGYVNFTPKRGGVARRAVDSIRDGIMRLAMKRGR
jgi:hypothetical protein